MLKINLKCYDSRKAPQLSLTTLLQSSIKLIAWEKWLFSPLFLLSIRVFSVKETSLCDREVSVAVLAEAALSYLWPSGVQAGKSRGCIYDFH